MLLLLLLLLQQQKRKATALILSSWLPCHQRSRPKSWSSRDESGVCGSGSDSNSKQLLQRRRSASALVLSDMCCTSYSAVPPIGRVCVHGTSALLGAGQTS